MDATLCHKEACQDADLFTAVCSGAARPSEAQPPWRCTAASPWAAAAAEEEDAAAWCTSAAAKGVAWQGTEPHSGSCSSCSWHYPCA